MFTKSAAFYDAVYSWKDYKTESAALHDFIRQHKSSDGSTLLDAACGTGGHIPYLRGHYQIEGFDLDDQMVAVARQRFPDVLFHQADMTNFDLGKQFDVVTCLFSSIGYVKTVVALRQTIRNFARHTRLGGVVIVEPWFSPGTMRLNHVSMLTVDQQNLKICRMSRMEFEGRLSILNFHYMVGTPENIGTFSERHELGLFTHEEYVSAFEAAGLTVVHDSKGLMERGVYIGKAGLSA